MDVAKTKVAYIFDNDHISFSSLYWKLKQLGYDARSMMEKQEIQLLFSQVKEETYLFINFDHCYTEVFKTLQYLENNNIIIIGYCKTNKEFEYLQPYCHAILIQPFLEEQLFRAMDLRKSG